MGYIDNKITFIYPIIGKSCLIKRQQICIIETVLIDLALFLYTFPSEEYFFCLGIFFYQGIKYFSTKEYFSTEESVC